MNLNLPISTAKISGALFVLLLINFCPVTLSARKISHTPGKDTIDLSGEWLFKTDPEDKGIIEKWYNDQLPGRIKLPGSMATNAKGDEITVNTPWTGSIEDSSWFYKPEYAAYRKPGNIKVPFWLQPDKYYKGAAWYQKTVDIPASWVNKPVEIFIERAHWETLLYVDGKPYGMRNSLATPHIFTIDGLAPGRHLLSIRIDNRIKDIDVGKNSHSLTDHTQGNWNGMIGKIYLTVHREPYIANVALFPDIFKKQVTAKIVVNSLTGGQHMVQLSLQALSEQAGAEALPAIIRKVSVIGVSDTIQIIYPMGATPRLWSEFHPSLYRMKISVSARGRGTTNSTLFGMRSFSEKGTQFTINGHPTFLRGTLDCAAFPLTGYPPTDVTSWAKILKTCKDFGLNHIRFHSWCPPDAAFEAADRLGMYLQIECSSWANQGAVIGDGKPLDKYIYEESNRITDTYGNHPSFCMLVYGNEPAGQHLTQYLTGFVKYWKARDSRRLYSTGSGWPIIPEANYNSTPDPRIQHWGEGLKSIINSKRPSTDYDWAAIIKPWQHPTVSHEIGQWCVYPDFNEIGKYTGVYKAKNFEIFRDKLSENGMADLGEQFLNASGKLQTLCYKADIEAALRTKGFGGFQLLGLEDFPGQGTALVGVLNAFYKPKAYISAAQYHEFCNSVVPLARFPKMVYLDNETLQVPVEVAQFSGQPIKNVAPLWKITNVSGAVISSGKFKTLTIPEGNGIVLGAIKQSLAGVKGAQQLKLTVSINSFVNSWDFFVYPAKQEPVNKDIIVTDHLTPAIIEKLNNGSKVLLTLKKGSLKSQFGGDVAIGFSSIFWNTAWTHGQPPETLGILCDAKHPSLKNFPTQGFSNWQWWDATTNSSPIMLDSVKSGLKPIVRVIDDWVKARSLGLVFECRVGMGRLIVSGVDLLSDDQNRPEARQLRYSLEQYMSTSDFNPLEQVNISKITTLTN